STNLKPPRGRERAPWPMPRLSRRTSRAPLLPALSAVAGRHFFWHTKFMAETISRTRKSKPRGRPPTGAESIHLRLLPDQLVALDQWIGRQPDAPSRPEAIRRLIVY